MDSRTWDALGAVGQEIERARQKFPTNRNLFLALSEEVGELAKELLERGNGDSVRAEAMQVACVAIRIMTEGSGETLSGRPYKSYEAAVLDCKPGLSEVVPPPVPNSCFTRTVAEMIYRAKKADRKVKRDAKQAVAKAAAASGIRKPGPRTWPKTCVICGKAFVPHRKDQKCCSTVCGKRRWLAGKPSPKAAAPTAKQERDQAGGATRIERIKVLAGYVSPIPERVRDAAAEARESDNMN